MIVCTARDKIIYTLTNLDSERRTSYAAEVETGDVSVVDNSNSYYTSLVDRTLATKRKFAPSLPAQSSPRYVRGQSEAPSMSQTYRILCELHRVEIKSNLA